ncbi:MAG: hypothetical protein DI598_03600 [Pseudopedobacter saltans]|uniref:Uncharacterized protein n=1 Tax=Pseudopedobacter saltans TaxID=151895 RepID=A0A2W5F791_9SPHI|nr:MAG: hypothetical protein DI598_03600 [Pseudopedobacter saltans]
MEKIWELLLPAIISSSVASLIIGLFLKKKTETITAEIKNQFEQNMTMFKSGFLWKEKAVSDLLGPLYMQFNRTHRAFRRYHTANLYLEAKILKDGNEKIRNLLLERAYLIPNELLEDANTLIEHYDVWLEEFNKLREANNQKDQDTFVFAGPLGHPFPKNAEQNFKSKYHELWNELYAAK